MSVNRSKELEKHGKKGANRGEIEDGPSNLPLASSSSDEFPDGGVDMEGRAEEIELQDPLTVFGSEIMVMILSQLDARSVARSRLVSRGWHSIASSDEIWARKVPSCFNRKLKDECRKTKSGFAEERGESSLYLEIPPIQLDSYRVSVVATLTPLRDPLVVLCMGT